MQLAAHRLKPWSMQPPLSFGARLPQENIVWSVCFASGTAGRFGSATPNAVVFSRPPNASLSSGWPFAAARFALHSRPRTSRHCACMLAHTQAYGGGAGWVAATAAHWTTPPVVCLFGMWSGCTEIDTVLLKIRHVNSDFSFSVE